MWTWGPRYGVETDPYWAQVLRLYHFDDSNGATTAIDSKGLGNMSRIAGTGTVQTVEKKFGNAMYGNTGSGQWQSTLGAEATGVSNWTVEGFFKRNAASPSQGFGFFYIDANTHVIGGNPSFSNVSFAESGTPRITATGPFTVAAGWIHIAASVENIGGNNRRMRLFIDGGLIGSYDTANGSSLNLASGEVLNIGRNSSAGFANLDMYVDEVRLTAACRYTASFTPPALPYPES